MALTVPIELVDRGADSIQTNPTFSTSAAKALAAVSNGHGYRARATDLIAAWGSADGEVSGAAIAAGLRSAARSAANVRQQQRTSLVWTGPSTPSLGFRSTRAVLSTLVANAQSSLLLVSFASYDVDDLVDSLLQCSERGVEITMVLETPNDPGGPLQIDDFHPFGRMRERASFFRWPAEAREAEFAPSARLHAKCVVADSSSALVTSANLTNAGINDNIELGTLIEAGDLPTQLAQHFRALIEQGTLEQLT